MNENSNTERELTAEEIRELSDRFFLDSRRYDYSGGDTR